MTLEQLQAGVVIPLDKPRGWTSFQAVNKVKAAIRNAYGIKKFKIGHAGTLDPLATGLLLVCVGKATKTIPSLQDGDKVYTGTMVLGATTPCFDLERAIDRHYPYTHITEPIVREAAAKLTGTIMQVPPMFSAVKVEGQRAYGYARTGDPTVVLQPKPVNVYGFEITAFRPGRECDGWEASEVAGLASESHLYQHPQGSVPDNLPQADFRIHCGKGTYVRSLARDLGQSVGSGAFLSALRREKVGNYSVDQAITVEQVEAWLRQPTSSCSEDDR